MVELGLHQIQGLASCLGERNSMVQTPLLSRPMIGTSFRSYALPKHHIPGTLLVVIGVKLELTIPLIFKYGRTRIHQIKGIDERNTMVQTVSQVLPFRSILASQRIQKKNLCKKETGNMDKTFKKFSFLRNNLRNWFMFHILATKVQVQSQGQGLCLWGKKKKYGRYWKDHQGELATVSGSLGTS